MRLVLYSTLLTVSLLLAPGAARATDEINMGSPYQKFDPETGYYVTVNPKAQPHTPQGSNAGAAPAHTRGAPANGNPQPAAGEWPSTQLYVLLGGSILVLGALAAVVVRFKKSRAGVS